MDICSSDSDWDSSSDSGFEDQEEADFLYGGQAQSILSSLEQSIEKIDDLLSFERGFVHGDTVFSANDPSGQMGRVVGVDMLVDLENVYGKKLRGVNSKSLAKVRSFSAGDHVSFGPWVGRVDRVLDRVTIVFDDGTKYQVDNATDQDKVSPVSTNVLEDAQLPYCPGQRVRLRLSAASKSTRWLCGNWKESQDEGTVSAVESGLVRVDWISSVVSATNPDLPSPPSFVDSEKLAPVPCSQHASWQLGDWCKLAGGHENSNSDVGKVYEITKTKTKADVAWQDGSVSFGVDSQTLVPATAVNSHEFWPGQFVLEKGGCDESDASSAEKWGVVLRMDAKERTVTVQWTNKELSTERTVETVSSYELVEHPDYNYCFGNLVLRLVPIKCCECDRETVSERECPDKDYLPFIGSVVGLIHGAVEVKWATGITSKVEPSEISRVEKTELVAAVSEDGDSEDLNIEKIPQDKEGYLNSDAISNGCKNQLWQSTSFYLPQAAIGFFTNIAATLLGTSGSNSVSGSTPLVHVPRAVIASSGKYSAVITTEGNDDVRSTETQIDDAISIVEDCFDQDDVEKISPESENTRKFKQFDMATDCTDHHFLASAKGFSMSQVKRSWLKKVHQEWNILEKNLPDSIYVRIFEERMDLMRAAIVGAPGTPYQDGLFLFDIYLPPEYPNEPPMVHYNSGGLRVNPNLYESGKVCLSLLNTWVGLETEVWSPERSTILQVLLSLQALVLNEKPYFNEAGYDQQVGRAEGEKNSVSYNEIAYLGTCKSMLYLLRKPLKHFEELVEEHFERRSQHILTACKVYIEGAPVGCDKTEHGHQNGSSTGFKIMLSKLFPKLVEAFSDKDKVMNPKNMNP